MATWNVSNATQLQNALNSASSGDTIILASGDYGSLNIQNKNFTSYVTIKSAESQGAHFTNISVLGSSYVRIDGVHVDNGGNGSSASKLVTFDQGSDHVQLLNSEVNGSVDGNYSGWYGVHAGVATNVRFENNYIHDVKNGGVFLGSDGVEVVGNTFDYLGNDTLKFAGNDGVLIENNIGARNIFPSAGAHLDMIQFQGSANNITIRGNVLIPETEADVQAIFMADGTYNNVLIEQNIIYTGMVHGVTLYSGSNVTVRNNTVLNMPDLVHGATVINVPDGSVVQYNITGGRSGGGQNGTNIVAQHSNPSGSFYYGDLFSNALIGLGATLEDLRPVAGSLIDFGSGYGAEQRLAELLLGSSGEPGNNRPIADNDGYATNEDTAITVTPLDGDIDPDGDALAIVSATDPAFGSIQLNADSSITYTPDADFFGVDSFTYIVRDSRGGTDSATVTINVRAVNNDAPDARDDSVLATAGSPSVIDVLSNDRDADGHSLVIDSNTVPAHGGLVRNADGTFTYLPDAGYTGTDSFTYTVKDPTGRTDTATVNITVWDVGALPSPVFAEGTHAIGGSLANAVVRQHRADYLVAEGTLAMAFTTTSLSGLQGLFSKDSSGFDNGGHISVLLDGNDVLVRLQSTSASHEIRAVDAVSSNSQHHLALTFGADGMKLYLDGALAGSNPYPGGLLGNAEPIVIGANQWASGDLTADALQDPFQGTIGSVDLYAAALPSDIIASLAGSPGTGTGGDPGGTEDPNVIEGTDGDDKLTGQDRAEVMRGKKGNDLIKGNGGSDWLSGDEGADTIDGGTEDDVIIGGADDDLLFGRDGADWLRGASGHDTLYGGAGADTLDGGSGNDYFRPEVTDFAGDEFNGGSGRDHFDLRFLSNGFELDLLIGSLDYNAAEARVSGMEVVTGTAAVDRIFGADVAETFYGGAGDDFLRGRDGDDALWGGSGLDVLSGEDGDDLLHGEAAFDRLIGGRGFDTIYGGDGDDFLRGDQQDDRLYGEGDDDRLIANGGDDFLSGGPGNDLLDGGPGVDRFFGGSGNDRIYGRDGDDTIDGGTGNDRLSGGAGADVFVFKAGEHVDRIVDWENGIDLIDLSGHAELTDMTQVNAAAEQRGADVFIISGGGDDVIVLKNATLGDLDAGDFVFS